MGIMSENNRRAVSIKTVGCRTNQADSLELMLRLMEHGIEIRDGFCGSSLIIINSCAVTSRAEKDVRMFISRAKKSSPEAFIWVMGCMTEIYDEGYWRQLGVHRVVRRGEQKICVDEIVEYLHTNKSTMEVESRKSCIRGRLVKVAVKVQEGCGMNCSYCIVPTTRGRERSVTEGEVLRKILYFKRLGASEIVLTGTHLGRWGYDLTPKKEIHHLLDYLLSRASGLRIRLSSIEPMGVTEQLIKIFSQKPADLCRHLHIPLQSGSDAVLKAMLRPYTTSDYRKLLDRVKTANPDMSIGTDVMVGFPSESVEEFNETRKFIQLMPLSYLHIFSFSPRPHTKAYGMKSSITHDEIKERVHILKQIDSSKRKAYMSTFIGREIDVIIEKVIDHRRAEGTSDTFIRSLIVKWESDNPYKPGARVGATGLRIVSSRDRLFLLCR